MLVGMGVWGGGGGARIQNQDFKKGNKRNL